MADKSIIAQWFPIHNQMKCYFTLTFSHTQFFAFSQVHRRLFQRYNLFNINL